MRLRICTSSVYISIYISMEDFVKKHKYKYSDALSVKSPTKNGMVGKLQTKLEVLIKSLVSFSNLLFSWFLGRLLI